MILTSISLLGFMNAQAQTAAKVQTETFEVKGLCSMCETRIENAALITGVKSAEWNKETHQITVIFNPQKVTLQTIHNAIANAGHQTSLVAPNMDAYKKLPACCAYLKGTAPACGHQH